MCGIAGSVAWEEGLVISGELLAAMAEEIKERGPDGGNMWVGDSGRVGMAHRRLAILDLSEEAFQPMKSRDGKIVISFNGEIYNYAEIREELNRRGGYSWKTDHSDTEVIIHAYEEWGIGCLDRFRGMFAFALWDGARKKLWLVRDRLGIKPLYYSVFPGKLNFASNIRALLRDPDQEREMDEEGLCDFLSLLAVPAPKTLFRGIRKLEAGAYMEVDCRNGKSRVVRYWDALDYYEPKAAMTEDTAISRLMSELRSSVEYRKVGDVPVGVFLSGGVDSSVNLELFTEKDKGKRIKTFTAGYTDTKLYKNENKYARYMAKRNKTEHFDVLLSEKDLLDFLPRFWRQLDDPAADPVAITQYFVADLARREDIKVIQAGEGADELFAGYLYWSERLAYEKINRFTPLPLKKLVYKLARGRLESPKKLEMLRRAAEGQSTFWGSLIYCTKEEKDQILGKRVLENLKGYTPWENFRGLYERFLKKARKRDILKWMTYVTLNYRLPDLLLARMDKTCMSVGVETRVPFLDHRLVELVMNMPEKVLLGDGRPKYLLKKAVKTLLPDKILNRKKAGFGLPVIEWYKSELGNRMRSEIDYFLDHTDYLNRQNVRRIVHARTDIDIMKIFSFYVLALWWRNYIEGKGR